MKINNSNNDGYGEYSKFFSPDMLDITNILTYNGKTYKVEHQTVTDLKTGETWQFDELRDLGLIHLLKKVLLGIDS